MDYAIKVNCIDINNPECLCEACKQFFEYGFKELIPAANLPMWKFNPFILAEISRKLNQEDNKL